MMNSVRPETPYPSKLPIIVFVYFTLNMLAQYLASPTADLDQAEQLLLAQYFQLGYSEQPPLYTWLVLSVFALTGQSLAVLLAIKALLLTGVVATLLALGKRLGFGSQQLLIVVLSVVFIPQIIWESQRDLTHSVLATLMAAMTLLQVIRTQQRANLLNFALLGVVVGLGLITKYNFTIFLSAIILTVLCVGEYRRMIIKPGLLLSIAVASAIALPHFLWAINHVDIVLGNVHKLKIEGGNPFQGLPKALLSALAYLSPLWLIALILLGKSAYYQKHVRDTDQRFLLCLLLMVLAVVMVFSMVTGTQKIKDRWYQPLLFFIPLWVAILARPTPRRLNIYAGFAIFFALLVSFALTARTVLTDQFNHRSRPNMPYITAIKAISAEIAVPDVILADGKLLAGNARAVFKQTYTLAPNYAIKPLSTSGTALVLCETEDCSRDNFKKWLMDKYNIDVNALTMNAREYPFYYSEQHSKTFYWAVISL